MFVTPSPPSPPSPSTFKLFDTATVTSPLPSFVTVAPVNVILSTLLTDVEPSLTFKEAAAAIVTTALPVVPLRVAPLNVIVSTRVTVVLPSATDKVEPDKTDSAFNFAFTLASV